MIYTLFFSRMRDLSEDERAEYAALSAEMHELVTTEHPAFIDIKTYVAEDGERLSVARFADEESMLAWARDARHVEVQERGRELFYERYRSVTCAPVREREWSRDGAASTPGE